MQRTDNFNLIVVEGSDTVNLLTQMNPNTEVIDEQMFKNQNAGVQTATELLSGTVHAITRSIPDASMIRFTAVSRFTAGDTFTVDGVQVSALLPSGEQLPDGAFIIGSEVLCVLKGTLLTVFASGGAVALAKDAEKLGGQLPAYYATKAEVDSAQNTANSAGSLAENNRQRIAEFENSLEWKIAGNAVGRMPISLPAEYNELLIASYVPNTGYMFSTIINKDMLENGTYTYLQDGFDTDYRAYWVYDNTSITLNGLVANGDYSTTAITTLYYR